MSEMQGRADQQRQRPRQRAVDGNENDDGVDVGSESHITKRRRLVKGAERGEQKRFVLVFVAGEECDCCCVVKIPSDYLSPQMLRALRAVAGTYCFEDDALRSDPTGVLLALHHVLGGDLGDCEPELAARTAPHDSWRRVLLDDGVALESGEVATDAIFVSGCN